MEPRSVGVPESTLILGKHSGRHALHERCAALGHQLSKEELDVVYRQFIGIADTKKGVTNDEILHLIEHRHTYAAQAD
jgi:2-isopropylmalate synthase